MRGGAVKSYLGAAARNSAKNKLRQACRTVPLPEGRWKLLCDGVSSSLWRGESTLRQDGIYRRFITGREQAAGWKL